MARYLNFIESLAATHPTTKLRVRRYQRYLNSIEHQAATHPTTKLRVRRYQREVFKFDRTSSSDAHYNFTAASELLEKHQLSLTN
jgi:hypothetical protein